MQQPLTYWKDRDGHVISEDRLIEDISAGRYAEKIVVLDDYNGRGGIVPFRHPEMKMIRFDAWIEGMILAIHQGDTGKAYLTELFRQYDCICLPDLDFLCGKSATMELLATAILAVLPQVRIVIHGNQLIMLAPYLLELLGDRTVCFSICRDEP